MGGPFQSFDWLEPFFDKRLKVPLPIDYPYSVHGLIIAEFNQGVISRGTGTLIGEDTVLTAAHCLYHKYHPLDKEFHPAHTIFFIPSIHLKPSFKLDSIEIKGLKADKFFVHKDYLNNDENFDFGVIKLSYPLGFNVGFAQIVAHEDEALQSLKVNVTGYPAHKGVISTFFKSHVYDLYTMQGPITTVKKHKVYYNIHTSGGQSGAGIWNLDTDEIVTCFGIHVTGSKEEGNGAIRINPENFDTITDWVRKHNNNGASLMDKIAS